MTREQRQKRDLQRVSQISRNLVSANRQLGIIQQARSSQARAARAEYAESVLNAPIINGKITTATPEGN